jgi:hypothetical protein
MREKKIRVGGDFELSALLDACPAFTEAQAVVMLNSSRLQQTLLHEETDQRIHRLS